MSQRVPPFLMMRETLSHNSMKIDHHKYIDVHREEEEEYFDGNKMEYHKTETLVE